MALTTLRAKTTAALAAAAFATGGVAVAQTAQTQQPAPAEQAIQPVTDAEIDQFIAANTEVATIAQSANQQLQQAEDQASAQQIQATAQEQMVAAIQEEGLTPTRFTQIVQLARADENLANKLRAKMEG